MSSSSSLSSEEEFSLVDKYITVAGIIGVGKTTLAEQIAKELNIPVFHEPVIDNEYLEDFYKDPKTHALTLQFYLLNQRFKQQQHITWAHQTHGAIQDRSIYEDPIFAKVLYRQGYIQEREFKLYQDFFKTLSNFMCRPNLILYLKIDAETALQRIRKRGRECEKGITLEYLQLLNEEYDTFMESVSKTIPVITINWTEFLSIDQIIEQINNKK